MSEAALSQAPEPLSAAQIFGDRLAEARRFGEFLAAAGTLRGLIGPREVPRIWDRHLLNCAVVSDLLPADARVVDVGSGAGLPGIPLALRRPDLHIDLVEPLQRRVEFLREAVELVGISEQVRVVRGRAEDAAVVVQYRDARWITARAVAPLDRLVRWCLPLLEPGGTLLALKGVTAGEEVRQHSPAIRSAGGGNVRVVRCGEGVLETPAVVVLIDRVADARPKSLKGRS